VSNMNCSIGLAYKYVTRIGTNTLAYFAETSMK
jgi:hypothetical protein